MRKVTIYHNPNCSKSRKALEILEGADVELEVVEYLKNPPTRVTIERLLAMCDDSPGAFVRDGDRRFVEAGLQVPADGDSVAVAELLSTEPAVMQRPIVVVDGRAIIARPPERVLELI